MAQTIDNSAVVSRLSDQANFLAIKLKSGSTNYTHFAQIYQFVPVPSLFFIGRNGTPLEVVCAGVEANNLATRIDRILEEHRKEKSPLVQPSTSSQNVKEQTVNLLHSEAASSAPVKPEPAKAPEPRAKEPETSEPAAKIPKTDNNEVQKAEEFEVVCDGDVCVRRPKTSDTPGSSKRPELELMDTQPSPATAPVPDVSAPVAVEPEPAAGPSDAQVSPSDSVRDIEDKLERAKELIEARRREKAEKEKELEKEKEIERRATGKGVAELKKWQADQELKQIQVPTTTFPFMNSYPRLANI
ncbi:hypothetical protein O3G_MSEX003345 [Manduca sexta]|uniref:UBX domain-containing protein n=1 Tax=Manduca sexta TaxID=7130 RepID=A0A921YRU8_MANSE|nr:hypothetical protein O3G_MSEX003345 [Manduca sexta]